MISISGLSNLDSLVLGQICVCTTWFWSCFEFCDSLIFLLFELFTTVNMISQCVRFQHEKHSLTIKQKMIYMLLFNFSKLINNSENTKLMVFKRFFHNVTGS